MSIYIEALTAVSPWTWVIFGMILCAAEMAAPGSFLIWIGLGAIATGAILALAPPLGLWALILFAFFALAFALLGQRFYGARRSAAGMTSLNQGAQEFVGQEFKLDEPIHEGIGRIRSGDTVWRVSGPDMPVGRNVRVVAVEKGVMLKVEAA